MRLGASSLRLFDEVGRLPGPLESSSRDVCPHCGTELRVSFQRGGAEHRCPACRRALVVSAQGEQEAGTGVDLRPDTTYLAVVCGRCATRMYAAENQVGREITCPDCQTRSVVPTPKARKTHDPMADADEEYAVGQPIERPEIRVGIDYREEGHGADGLPSDRVRWHTPETQDPPPRWTFFSGVFTFPFYRSSLVCLIALSFVAIVVLPVFLVSIALSYTSSHITMIGSMVLFSVSGTFLVLGIAVASAYLLAIIRETANGHDHVVDWPEALFLEWISDSYFVFSSLAISILPGLAMRHVLDAVGRPTDVCIPLSMLILFPVLLVSMLETNSPLNPISLPVLGTLLTAWWAWGLFFIESTMVMAAALWVAGALAAMAGLLGTIAGAAAVVPAVMIYCRLLGRVVWCGSGMAAEAVARRSGK